MNILPNSLRNTTVLSDDRLILQREFALKHLPKDEMFKLVSLLYEVVPPVLLETGKVEPPLSLPHPTHYSLETGNVTPFLSPTLSCMNRPRSSSDKC
jgi:hypothetical protein